MPDPVRVPTRCCPTLRGATVSPVDTSRQEQIADIAVGKIPWRVTIR
jgi:hypothetical protein